VSSTPPPSRRIALLRAFGEVEDLAGLSRYASDAR